MALGIREAQTVQRFGGIRCGQLSATATSLSSLRCPEGRMETCTPHRSGPHVVLAFFRQSEALRGDAGSGREGQAIVLQVIVGRSAGRCRHEAGSSFWQTLSHHPLGAAGAAPQPWLFRVMNSSSCFTDLCFPRGWSFQLQRKRM